MTELEKNARNVRRRSPRRAVASRFLRRFRTLAPENADARARRLRDAVLSRRGAALPPFYDWERDDGKPATFRERRRRVDFLRRASAKTRFRRADRSLDSRLATRRRNRREDSRRVLNASVFGGGDGSILGAVRARNLPQLERVLTFAERERRRTNRRRTSLRDDGKSNRGPKQAKRNDASESIRGDVPPRLEIEAADARLRSRRRVSFPFLRAAKRNGVWQGKAAVRSADAASRNAAGKP